MELDNRQTSLKSPSYIGLLVAQFLACFNDQAIHYVAIFYAVDMLIRYVGVRNLEVRGIVTIVTACFLAPFFFFSPLAGVLADKFSKRSTIVFWKMAEVGFMALALVGFLLPHLARFGWASPQTLAECSSLCLVATVFLMGMHSTFFIPAKYGIMPELLHPSILSRGNGLLEGTSFTGNILGTVFGGLVYEYCHSTVKAGVIDPGREWILGLVLFGLAVAGAIAALRIVWLPPAAPDRPLVWQPWVPLRENLGLLRKSRPLVVATIGIAFFTFVTLFYRQTLIFKGETDKDLRTYKQMEDKATGAPSVPTNPSIQELEEEFPSDSPEESELFEDAEWGPPAPDVEPPHVAAHERNEEFRIALLIACIGLGVGIGCTAAGMVSGDRIELGLVPFGALSIIVLTGVLAWVTTSPQDWPRPVALFGVGIGAGLYIVPLYTLLQHRAPKESKGNLVALSNFLNVTGGLVAIGVFYFITMLFQRVLGLDLTHNAVQQNPQRLHDYVQQLGRQTRIPPMLFLCAALITLVILYHLSRMRPDFLLRMISWFRYPSRRRLHTVGLANVPSNGPIVLATNSYQSSQWIEVMSAIDRGSRLLRPAEVNAPPQDDRLMDSLARKMGLIVTPGTLPGAETAVEWERLIASGVQALLAGNLVGLVLDGAESHERAETLLRQLHARVGAEILPVHCGIRAIGKLPSGEPNNRMTVMIGQRLPPDSSPADIRAAIESLQTESHAGDL